MELWLIFTTAFVVGLSGAMMPGPLLTVAIGESARRGFIAGPLIVLGHGILEAALVAALALGLAAFLAAAAVAKGIALVGGLFLIYLGWGMFKDARAGKVALALPSGREPGAAGCAAPVLRGEAGATAAGCGAAEKEEEISTAGTAFTAGYAHPAKTAGTAKVAGAAGAAKAVKTAKGMHPVLAGFFISLSNPYWSLWWATVGLGYITFSLQRGTVGLASFFTGHILSDLVWYSAVAGMIAGGRRFLKPAVYQGILVICGLFLIGLGAYFVFWGATA